MTNATTFRCSKCKESKSADAYHLCDKNKRGLAYWCKDCLQVRHAGVVMGARGFMPCPQCGLPNKTATTDCDSCMKTRGVRECRVCKVVKPWPAEFYWGHAKCRMCLMASQKRKGPQKSKKPATPSQQRARILRHLYGLSEADHDAIRIHQKGLCAICLTETRALCVDHDHKTGKVRGLLCRSCNTGLGGFKDDLPALERAQKYLLAPPAADALAASASAPPADES